MHILDTVVIVSRSRTGRVCTSQLTSLFPSTPLWMSQLLLLDACVGKFSGSPIPSTIPSIFSPDPFSNMLYWLWLLPRPDQSTLNEWMHHLFYEIQRFSSKF